MKFDCKKTSTRLKRLRESKKLSHDKLSDEIEDRYGVHIDKKTLINYEKAETLSSKPEAVKGMNITRLTALADYYGVSTDYLLGVSDCPSIRKDVKVIQKTLGISPKATKNLISIVESSRTRALPFPSSAQKRNWALVQAMNVLFESDDLLQIIESIANLTDAANALQDYKQYSANDFLEDDLEHAEDRLGYIDHCYRVARLDVSEAILNCMDNRILGKREEIQIYTAARKNIESALQMKEQLAKIQEAELIAKHEDEEKEWLDYLEREGLDEDYGGDEKKGN